MSILQLFEFTFKFSLSAPDTATWIYVILILIVFILAIGLGWGKMWNREWSLGGHVGSLILILIFAMLAAYSVFNLRGISRMETWFQQQRTTLAHSIADSAKFNRTVLIAAWDKLNPRGKQEGLTPPAEGGNDIRLATPEDAHALATIAAEETRSALRNKMPFSLGLPIATRNPADIATEAVDAIRFDASRFPTVVAASNEWSSTAATLQANHALDTAYNTLSPGLLDLKVACLWLLFVSVAIPVIAVPWNALKDIKVNPTTKR